MLVQYQDRLVGPTGRVEVSVYQSEAWSSQIYMNQSGQIFKGPDRSDRPVGPTGLKLRTEYCETQNSEDFCLEFPQCSLLFGDRSGRPVGPTGRKKRECFDFCSSGRTG